MEEKFNWYVADNQYVSYLKNFDDKVENIDYNERMKPYIGILITINKFNYYVPISSVKKKHYKMKEGIDFIKIINKNKVLGVLNLNNMIPIANDSVKLLKYKEIEKYRNFNSEEDKSLYISLLSTELSIINDKIKKIKSNSIKLYNEKINKPNSNISKRCCNFTLLEEKCREWETESKILNKKKNFNVNEDLGV